MCGGSYVREMLYVCIYVCAFIYTVIPRFTGDSTYVTRLMTCDSTYEQFDLQAKMSLSFCFDLRAKIRHVSKFLYDCFSGALSTVYKEGTGNRWGWGGWAQRAVPTGHTEGTENQSDRGPPGTVYCI